MRQTPLHQPERRQPRNLEPNLGDIPAEIVRSPQCGAKLLSQAFVTARPSRGWCAKHGQGAPDAEEQPLRDARRFCVAVFDPSTFQGWLAPIWPPGPELLNTSGMSNLELACRNANLVRLLDLWSAPGRTRAVGPGPMSGTQRWGFSGTAPMPRACGRPAQRLSPQPFRVAPGRHAHGGCTATFRTWPGT